MLHGHEIPALVLQGEPLLVILPLLSICRQVLPEAAFAAELMRKPLVSMASAATVLVLSAVDVAMYRVLLIERSVQAFEPLVPSVSASCAPLGEAIESAPNGVVVPMPMGPLLAIYIRI